MKGGNGTRNFKTNSPNSEKSGNIVSLFIASCSVSQNTTSNSTAKQSDRMIQSKLKSFQIILIVFVIFQFFIYFVILLCSHGIAVGDQGFKMKDVRHILGEFALFMLEHFEMESDGNNNHQTSSRDNKTTVKEAEGVDKGNEDMSKKGTSAEVSSAAKKRIYPGNDNSQPKRKFVDFVNSTEYFSPLKDDDGLPKDAEYYSLLHPDPGNTILNLINILIAHFDYTFLVAALNQEELSALYISNFAKKVTGIFSDGYDEEGDDGTNTKIISDLTSMIKDGCKNLFIIYSIYSRHYAEQTILITL